MHCFAPDTKLVYIHNYGGVALRNGNKCRSPYPLRIASIVKTLMLRFGLTPDGVRCVVPLIALLSIMPKVGLMPPVIEIRPMLIHRIPN